jgi:hypothetical protein
MSYENGIPPGGPITKGTRIFLWIFHILLCAIPIISFIKGWPYE